MQMKTKCFQKLAQSQPSMIIIVATIIGMTAFAGLSLYFSTINLCILAVVVLCAIPHSFSWFLLQNSSSYYLVSLLLIITSSGIEMKKMFGSVLSIFILSQIEPIKPGDFKANFIFSQSISNLIMNQTFQISFLLFQAYFVTTKLY